MVSARTDAALQVGPPNTRKQHNMNDALETLYAMRIMAWCRQDKMAIRQINRDIESLKNDMRGLV